MKKVLYFLWVGSSYLFWIAYIAFIVLSMIWRLPCWEALIVCGISLITAVVLGNILEALGEVDLGVPPGGWPGI